MSSAAINTLSQHLPLISAAKTQVREGWQELQDYFGQFLWIRIEHRLPVGSLRGVRGRGARQACGVLLEGPITSDSHQARSLDVIAVLRLSSAASFFVFVSAAIRTSCTGWLGCEGGISAVYCRNFRETPSRGGCNHGKAGRNPVRFFLC